MIVKAGLGRILMKRAGICIDVAGNDKIREVGLLLLVIEVQ